MNVALTGPTVCGADEPVDDGDGDAMYVRAQHKMNDVITLTMIAMAESMKRLASETTVL